MQAYEIVGINVHPETDIQAQELVTIWSTSTAHGMWTKPVCLPSIPYKVWSN